MKLRILLLAPILLSGCAVTADRDMYLKVASAPSMYPKPINIKEWSSTNFGWYLSRDTEFGKVTHYKALKDYRIQRRTILESQASLERKSAIPAFLVYEGEVNCETGKNKMVATTYGPFFIKESPLFQATYSGQTEVSQNICLLNWILEK